MYVYESIPHGGVWSRGKVGGVGLGGGRQKPIWGLNTHPRSQRLFLRHQTVITFSPSLNMKVEPLVHRYAP